MKKSRIAPLAVAAGAVLSLLTVTAPASGHAAPLPGCGSSLTVDRVGSVGRTCHLDRGSHVRIGPDLTVAVPERGIVASAAVLRTAPSSNPSEVSVFRSEDDRLAVRVDDGAARGDAAASAQLTAIVDRAPARDNATTAVPSWCGSTSYYSLHSGRWSGSQYRWLYNSRTQPNTGALSAITYGFQFITADSSTCGNLATGATHSYRGTTTRYTWGTRDNYNVVGWAGYGSGTLAMAYWWTDSNGYKVEADIGFNNRVTNWNTSPAGTVPSNRYDVISVATHEAGHVFGLNHYSHTTQVMNPSIGMGVNKRVKRSGDLMGMAVAY